MEVMKIMKTKMKIEKTTKVLRIAKRILMASGVILAVITNTAFAAGDPLSAINNLSTFIFSAIKAIGSAQITILSQKKGFYPAWILNYRLLLLIRYIYTTLLIPLTRLPNRWLFPEAVMERLLFPRNRHRGKGGRITAFFHRMAEST